jgi:F-type H+-transporting ATPase subunit b
MKAISTALFIAILLPLGLFAAAPEATEAAAEVSKLEEIAGKFGVTWPTLIAQMVNFCLVAAALYYLAVKPVAKTLDDRQQKIADGLQYAEEMKTQLAEAERERAEKIKEAAQEAQRILSEAREQSKEMIEQKTQEAANQAESIIRKASEATELERQKMLSDVRQEVARLVVATTSTVLSKELSEEDRKSFSDAAAKELAGSAN